MQANGMVSARIHRLSGVFRFVKWEQSGIQNQSQTCKGTTVPILEVNSKRPWYPTILRATIAAAALLLAVLVPSSAQDSTTITMNDAIRIALERNTTIERARNSLEISRARILQAEGAFLPNLGLGVTPSERISLGRSDSLERSDRFTTGLSISASSVMTLYSGGANESALAQAEGQIRVDTLELERTRATIAFSVVSAYTQLLSERELIALERQNLAAQQKLLERVEAFTQAGVRPVGELYTQRAQVAAAELRLVNAESAAEFSELRLRQLLRLEPGGRYRFIESGAGTGATPSAPSIATAELLVSQALARRNDLSAQQARIDLANEAIRGARAGYKPTISLNTSLGTSYSSSDAESGFAEQLALDRPALSIGVGLTLPLFDRNRTDAAVAIAEAQLKNEQLMLDDLKLSISSEVEQAYLQYATTLKQIDVTDRQVEAARQALDAETARYEVGASTLTEVIQARVALLSAETSRLQARNTLVLRRWALDYYVGAPVTGR
jgi:outer membrane protein